LENIHYEIMNLINIFFCLGFVATCQAADVIFGASSVLAHGKLDMIFLVDGSSSTGATSFAKAKQFMKLFVDKLSFGNDKSRIAVIQYSSNGVITEISFANSVAYNKDWIKNKIQNIPFRGGNKRTLEGLEAMKKEFGNHLRPLSLRGGVSRTGIILTDGKENEQPPAIAQAVDLMFMFDITGSMSGEINGVKAAALEMVNAVKREYPSAVFRTGFLGYRDTYDRVQFLPRAFDIDIVAFKNWMVSNVRASGGGDWPENVFGAMEQVMTRFEWEAPLTRILVHIADAPHRGNFRSTRGEQNTRKRAKILLDKLKCTTNIYSYLFVKTRSYSWGGLDHMLDAFKELSTGDCGSSSAAKNNWFTVSTASRSTIVTKIIDETKIAIKKVTYIDIARKLKEIDCDVIGVGISENADTEKLTEIVTSGGGKTKRVGSGGGGGGVIVPKAGEDLGDKITEALEKEIVKEIDMCSTNPCKNGGTCTSSGSTFKCACKSGSIGVFCDDNNECLTGNGGCSHICTNTPGSFTCSCRAGYTLSTDKKTCIDDDECSTRNGGCMHNCKNIAGSFECSCNGGYTLQGDKKSCVDINECNTAKGGCMHQCSNTLGSFQCSCNAGYELESDKKSCSDINECDSANGGCMHNCANNVGSYDCSCNVGYVLDSNNKMCNDVNECSSNNGGCMHTCDNYPGSYECLCNLGWAINADKKNCHRLCKKDGNIANPDDCESFLSCLHTKTPDEKVVKKNCTDGLHYNANRGVCDWPAEAGCQTKICKLGDLIPDPTDCRKFTVCENADGTGTSKTCPDGTHFSASLRVCDWPQNAGCLKDTCRDGYSLDEDGKTCNDIDECKFTNDCKHTCTNTDGSFKCSCKVGYTLDTDGKSCKLTTKKKSCKNHGELIQDKENCNGYYVCEHDNLTWMDCPSGLHFNDKIKVCDWPAQAGCQKSSCKLGETLPDPTDCRKYTVCENADGTGTSKTCPAGLHFNNKIKVCDWPAQANCIIP
jgi:hypothetical protein